MSSRFGWDDFASIAVFFLSAKALKSCRTYAYPHNHAIDNAGKQFFPNLTQKALPKQGLKLAAAEPLGLCSEVSWRIYSGKVICTTEVLWMTQSAKKESRVRWLPRVPQQNLFVASLLNLGCSERQHQ